MDKHLLLGAVLGVAAIVVAVFQNKRRAGLIAYYSGRRILYRDWIVLYGDEAKPKIQRFLRCFGSSFWVPREIIHKLGPDDGVMDFYHRDYSPNEPDALEANTFIRELKASFGYVADESDGALTMSQLFEKATGLKRKAKP